MSTQRKMRVLFVGALTDPEGGARGGQLTASMNLYESAIREHVDWLPLSSTFASVPPPPVWMRTFPALRRVLRFAWMLPRVDVALIFAASGFSLFEKTLMAVLARLAGRGVVMRMSGGPMFAQSNKHDTIRLTLSVAMSAANVICSQGRFWTAFFARFKQSDGKIILAPNPMVIPSKVTRSLGKTKRLLFAGRVQRAKGIFDLIPMLVKVLEHYPDARLSIAGSGEALEEFEQALVAHGIRQNVDLLGWVPPERMIDCLASADVFVFPSYSEGMPNAVLEAMLAETPVVVTEVGAVGDVVIPGETGQLFKPGDIATMTRSVLNALSDPHGSAAMARRGRALVERRHDAERVWRVYAAALNRAAEEAGRDCHLIEGATIEIEAAKFVAAVAAANG
jgi:glycosyltransferase involved in cell wall biosynthesis